MSTFGRRFLYLYTAVANGKQIGRTKAFQIALTLRVWMCVCVCVCVCVRERERERERGGEKGGGGSGTESRDTGRQIRKERRE